MNLVNKEGSQEAKACKEVDMVNKEGGQEAKTHEEVGLVDRLLILVYPANTEER